jgi:hypothetical protein
MSTIVGILVRENPNISFTCIYFIILLSNTSIVENTDVYSLHAQYRKSKSIIDSYSQWKHKLPKLTVECISLLYLFVKKPFHEIQM